MVMVVVGGGREEGSWQHPTDALEEEAEGIVSESRALTPASPAN